MLKIAYFCKIIDIMNDRLFLSHLENKKGGR